MNSLDQLVREKPLLAVGVTVIALVLIGVMFWLGFRFFNQPPPESRVMVVSFGDGQNEVIIERDGRVTIKTPFGTFTQQWDKEKIRAFFNQLDTLNFDLLAEFLGTELTLQLTLSTGEEVTILITEELTELTDEIQEVLETIYEEADFPLPTPFANPDSGNPFGDSSIGASPSPIPSSVSKGTTNPWKSGSDVVDPESFGCDETHQQGKRVVISNTVCAR